MVTDDKILAGMAEIFHEFLGVSADEVTLESDLVDDLDIDSLSMVEIVLATRDRFGVEIPDEEINSLKTVHDVVSYVKRAG
jgi:acyl carrier protein